MRRNKNQHILNSSLSNKGYTIVETLIFLAVTGVLFASAMLVVGGQQRKTEFHTGIREIESQLIDIMNDVSTGLYNNTGNFTCSTASSTTNPPTISLGSAPEQGTNAECIFVGRAIQFAPNGTDNEELGIYTLFGRRQVGLPTSGTDVRTLAEAAPDVPTFDQADATLELPYGIKIMSVSYISGLAQERGTIAFTNRFAGNAGSGGITGSQDIDIIAIAGTSLNQTKPAAKNNIRTNITAATSALNPNSGITLCFKSGGTDQHGKILIGGSGRQINTALTIGTGDC
ncbi:hypothetical protein H0X10_01570 [Candidatus Saccharibacteria bacterium]|nr:hypothetical protein [Candidatus Saccharibacteria bacterium]